MYAFAQWGTVKGGAISIISGTDGFFFFSLTRLGLRPGRPIDGQRKGGLRRSAKVKPEKSNKRRQGDSPVAGTDSSNGCHSPSKGREKSVRETAVCRREFLLIFVNPGTPRCKRPANFACRDLRSIIRSLSALRQGLCLPRRFSHRGFWRSEEGQPFEVVEPPLLLGDCPD